MKPWQVISKYSDNHWQPWTETMTQEEYEKNRRTIYESVATDEIEVLFDIQNIVLVWRWADDKEMVIYLRTPT